MVRIVHRGDLSNGAELRIQATLLGVIRSRFWSIDRRIELSVCFVVSIQMRSLVSNIRPSYHPVLRHLPFQCQIPGSHLGKDKVLLEKSVDSDWSQECRLGSGELGTVLGGEGIGQPLEPVG